MSPVVPSRDRVATEAGGEKSGELGLSSSLPGNLFRTAFFWIGCVGWTGLVAYTLAIPVAIVERVLRMENTQWAQTILHRGVKLCSLPLRIVSRVRLDAAARAEEGRSVVICNHHSYIDIFLLFHLFPRIHMSARETLFRIPFLGWAMTLLQHFPHDSGDPEGALRTGERWLARGRYVGIFPEGTRAPSGTMRRFRCGAFRLAQRSTQSIQPVVVVGTGRVWPKGTLWIRALGPMAMRVMPPVPVPAELDPVELRQLVRDVRQTMLDEYRRMEREIGLAGASGNDARS